MQRKRVAAAIAAIVLAAGTAAAQESPQPAESKQSSQSDIEVLLPRQLEQKEVARTVSNLYEWRQFREVVPRFIEPLCPRVAGVEKDLAQKVEARLSAVARYVGLDEAEANCRPNAFVIVLEEPLPMFNQLVAKRPGLLGDYEFRDLHINAIRGALKSGRPLVAWNQIESRNFDGPTLQDIDGPPTIRTPMASRLRLPSAVAKLISVVVFDKKQLVDVEAVQMADIAALHLLASPRRFADLDNVETPTLLTLFRKGPDKSPREMTAFDRAYLKGIYALRPGDWSNRVNRSVLAAYRAQCEEEGVACPQDTAPARK